MKRILSLVLTLAMVLSLMAGICVSVGAEEYTLIQEASVTGITIPELAVGDTLPALNYSVPAGANYAVTEAVWYKDGNTAAAGDAVETGHAYTLRIVVVANDGYAFDQNNITLLINGEEHDFMPVDGRGEGGFAECHFTKDYSFQEAIDKAEVSFEIPEIGKPLSEAKIPDGVNYTVTTDWYDASTRQSVAVGTTAAKGGSYEVQIRLFPVTGYEFTEDTEFWLNGELNDGADVDFDSINYWSDNYNFGEPIGSVSFTYAEPELGKPFPVPTVAGDNCEMDYSWWDYTAEEEVAAGAVVQKGHEYELVVWVAATAGYQFTDETKVTVNGAQTEDVDIDDMYVYYSSDIYDFREQITQVSLICPEPEVGKDLPAVTAPADAGYEVTYWWYDVYTGEEITGQVKDGGKYELNIFAEIKEECVFAEEVTFIFNSEVIDEDDYNVYSNGLEYYTDYSFAKPADKFEVSYELPQVGKAISAITIPEGANYTLGEESGWYDYFTGEKVTGKFEDGKRYEMRADLKLNFGYEVSENAVVYVNGEKTTNFGYGDTTVYVMKSYSFAESVAKVDLPAWPELKVGDKLPEITGEGEHYEYYVDWYGEDADGNYLESDTVVDGAIYYAYMYAYPKAGYEFTEDTKVTQNGKDPSGWLYTDYNYIELDTVYNFGVYEMIDKIELTTDIPGYGEKGGEVKAPEDADYEVEYTWGVASDDTYEDADVLSGTYQYGDRVLLVVFMDADDGYMFTPDVAITINGKEYEPVESDKYQDHVYMFYDLGEVTKPAATPETGDTTPVALLSLLCLSAVMGMGVLLNKKRAAR